MAGDVTSGTESGIVCLEYGNENEEYFLNQLWETTNSSYGTMHGIDVGSHGQYIYASGRTDGNIYKFNASTGEELGYLNLISTGGIRTGGIAISHQAIHENSLCCD